ncbi:MAG: hypothetical protein HGB12_09340, partial [Bacteroidetes bacterium]|nr:hypothetical protein [Bacteroidota bacterium]
MKFLNKLAGRYSIIYKFFLFLLSVTLIVLQFPKEGKFKYEFQKNKPWMHEDLIAPFDLAILKSDKMLADEKAVAFENLKPYFVLNSKVKEQKLKLFKDEFFNKWTLKYGEKNQNLRKSNYQTAISILDTIYSKGVIQLNDNLENKQNDYIINVVNGNISEEKELSDIFTIQTADDYIVANLNIKRVTDKDLMLPLLENAIAQNIFYDDNITKKYKLNILNEISLTYGMVQEGERIISKGELVTADKYQVIESLKKEYETQLGASSKYYKILI